MLQQCQQKMAGSCLYSLWDNAIGVKYEQILTGDQSLPHHAQIIIIVTVHHKGAVKSAHRSDLFWSM